jgi:serine/threonine protein kinase
LKILEQVADALGYCHRKNVLHRGLYPGAVLVKRKGNGGPGDGIETKLYNFQLAQSEDSQGTVHLSQLGGDQALVYRAPEVIEDPKTAQTASDVFSLGALAYFLFTGRHPGNTLAERYRLLQQAGGYLSPAALAAVDDSFALGKKPGAPSTDDEAAGDDVAAPGDLEEVLKFGTHQSPIERSNEPIEWVQILINELTTPPAPAPAAPELDPLEARVGQSMAGFLIEKVLGTGSTARVLRVSKEGRRYALKVSRSADLDERLRSEAVTLKKLRGDRIVAHYDTLTIAGRTALLLEDAGETLAEILNKEGAQSLDYAKRWGEDLLLALRELEKRHVLHRDIKPANLAVPSGEAKRTRNLFLFDFSLAEIDPAAVDVGTPVYRDPFVTAGRGWDEAADRFSAAMTLYEILTGARPRWGTGQVPATASTEEMTIEAERFDPAVRDRLLAFFKKAFARDAALRHDSAESMREEWQASFLSPKPVAAEAAAPAQGIDFTALRADTPIRAIEGLSARAKNALDRAGVIQVEEAFGLPENQLSALRGVGRETQKEILHFVQGLKAAQIQASAEAAFLPSFAGEDVAITELHGLSAAAVRALEGSGLVRARETAAAPRARLARLLDKVPDGLGELERALRAARRVDPESEPRSIEDWVHRAFPREGKQAEYVRELFGIDQAPGGGYAKDSSDLARRHRVAQPNISVALGKARERWRSDATLQPLSERVLGDLATLGGAARVDRAAELLLNALPHEPGESAERGARALVRLVAESSAHLKSGRLGEGWWLAESAAHLTLAKLLGQAADAISAREPLPSFEQARDELFGLVQGTVMSGVPAERLVALAADASSKAALSARLELYPRGLSAERALRLSASALSSPRLTPERIRQVVALRYPEAEPLPSEGQRLESLLQGLGLTLRDGFFERAALFVQSTEGTQIAHGARAARARKPTTDPEEQARREFEERVKVAARSRAFRVLEVNAAYADRAGAELAAMLGVTPISLEREVLHALDALVREREIGDDNVVYDTDHKGPDGSEDWAMLCEFVGESADRVVRALAAKKGTLLLTQPGILARYGLSSALHTLLQATQQDDGPGVFLVVPALSDPSPTPVLHAPHGSLPIPLSSPAQRLPIPDIWISNE